MFSVKTFISGRFVTERLSALFIKAYCCHRWSMGDEIGCLRWAYGPSAVLSPDVYKPPVLLCSILVPLTSKVICKEASPYLSSSCSKMFSSLCFSLSQMKLGTKSAGPAGPSSPSSGRNRSRCTSRGIWSYSHGVRHRCWRQQLCHSPCC